MKSEYESTELIVICPAKKMSMFVYVYTKKKEILENLLDAT